MDPGLSHAFVWVGGVLVGFGCGYLVLMRPAIRLLKQASAQSREASQALVLSAADREAADSLLQRTLAIAARTDEDLEESRRLRDETEVLLSEIRAVREEATQ